MIEYGFIYVLKDPRDGAIRYCGQTAYALRTRLWRHCSDAKKYRGKRHLANWISGLLDGGLLPVMEVIETVDISECYSGPILRDVRGRPARAMETMERKLVGVRLGAREVFHIARLRAEGHALTNATVGGEGTLGRKASPEAIEKTRQAHLGKKRTPEQCERNRAARIGIAPHPSIVGENSAWCRISDENVRAIFTSTESWGSLAAQYKINVGYVRLIQRGVKRAAATKGLTPVPFSRRRATPRISPETVAAILADTGFQYEIAAKYGVCQAYVSCIKRGVMRREVSANLEGE